MAWPAVGARTVWFFDLDNTLHDAGSAVFPRMNAAMTEYIREHLGLPVQEADALRVQYWQHYGSTLLGLMRHHRVKAAHFLHETHRFPDLEERVRGHVHDLYRLRRLPGIKILLTNAPAHYARRVLRTLRIEDCFEAVIPIEHMTVFGHLRPKPDRRLFRTLSVKMKVAPRRCVLVEDTLEHQKAARAEGWRTVWMQRWMSAGIRSRGEHGRLLHRRPRYVDRRLRSLAAL
ncbi:MAG: pyrimidine 5'-nucleotidase [Betaproteobacteria bacterium]|nr:pyrimidine 5'-nucleotidase [Betaproteobacteria bacterium]NBT09403.1 pyrimidine 5'-nucleotidase [Betaproteobacteria bacterium]NBU49439.1 pyrimidine 5'-nucleotidase [Betaproteobacteria bacterium]